MTDLTSDRDNPFSNRGRSPRRPVLDLPGPDPIGHGNGPQAPECQMVTHGGWCQDPASAWFVPEDLRADYAAGHTMALSPEGSRLPLTERSLKGPDGTVVVVTMTTAQVCEMAARLGLELRPQVDDTGAVVGGRAIGTGLRGSAAVDHLRRFGDALNAVAHRESYAAARTVEREDSTRPCPGCDVDTDSRYWTAVPLPPLPGPVILCRRCAAVAPTLWAQALTAADKGRAATLTRNLSALLPR